MKILDCKGFACPKPVILTKKEFENNELTELEVIVDNDAASINVSKFAASIGIDSEIIKKDELFHIRLTRSHGASVYGATQTTASNAASVSESATVSASMPAVTSSTVSNSTQGVNSVAPAACELMSFESKDEIVILVSSDKLGVGDDKLGAALMKSYMYALTESDRKPKVMLFLNGGVKLTCDGSDVLESIKLLESMGTEILSCGTCLDFYGLKDKLRIGAVTNMYTIIEKMHHATNTIKL